MDAKYGQVIIDSKASQLDKPFTYRIEGELLGLLKPGMRVIVPFGRGNRFMKGLLVAIEDEYEGKYKVKNIIENLDYEPIIDEDLFRLSMWMKEEYISPYFSSLQTVLPPGDYKSLETYIVLEEAEYKGEILEEVQIVEYLKKRKGRAVLSKLKEDLPIAGINEYISNLENKDQLSIEIDVATRVSQKTEKWIKLDVEAKSLEDVEKTIGNRAKKQLEVANYLYKDNDRPVKEILKKFKTSLSVLRSLEKKGLADIYDKTVHREAIKREIDYYEKHILNEEQEEVYRRIVESDEDEFLIHGVTGSGKTEIYLQLVQEMLSQNKGSIIMVPEISLTRQTIDRFVGRFGENVAILHSRLSQGERFDQWRRIKNGEVKIVIGARSAIFAPINNLGLIVIDEEHDDSYKSSQNPKYNTVEVAGKRIELEGGKLVLGTATPSLDSYYRVANGELQLLSLKNRVNNLEMPEIDVVDMRLELESGNRTIFSDRLYKAIEDNLKRSKQTILFLNRRGFSTFVSCRECGYVVECDNCDISMTLHRNINRLRCHYCGQTKPIPKTCPECKSEHIRHFGIGTEQVEYLTKEAFPEARIARMDGDTTRKKDSHDKILEKMENNEIDILIGTQMIAKGLDFKNLSLVGIIAADTALNLPNYSSAEKTYQLVTQVAGRAGRADSDGLVVLQTYNPDHHSIIHAKNNDYYGFVEDEMALREMFLYPPYIDLINIIIYGENRSKVRDIINQVYNILGNEIYKMYGEDYFNYIIGPNPAPLEKIKNNFRYQIILKSKKVDTKRLKDLIYRVCISNEDGLDLKDLKLNIEINPSTIL